MESKRLNLENEIKIEKQIIENDDLLFPDEKIRLINELEEEALRYAREEESEPAEFKDSW